MPLTTVIALVLSQTFTAVGRNDVIGAFNVLQRDVQAARAGTLAYSQNAAKTRLCVSPYAGTLAAGSQTVRFGAIVLSPAAQRNLGFALPAYATTWDDVKDAYAAMEIQAPPSTSITFDVQTLIANVDVLWNELELRATPLLPSCEVAIARADDASFSSVVRCACSTGANCTVGGAAAPVGRTLDPGTFTGTGCAPKPCVTRFDGFGVDGSWPASCPK